MHEKFLNVIQYTLVKTFFFLSLFDFGISSSELFKKFKFVENLTTLSLKRIKVKRIEIIKIS